jgi:site-specific recombinase XerD
MMPIKPLNGKVTPRRRKNTDLRSREYLKPYTTIQKVWSRLRKAAHDLMHQYASFLVNSGRTLYEVQQTLGHSTSKVTQGYSHLTMATLQSAAASAADRIDGTMPKSP